MQLAVHPAPSTAISLPEPAGQWLAPLLSEASSDELALAIIDRWDDLTPALARRSPQVSTLKAEAAGDAAEALGNLLTFTAAQFNVGKNLNDGQIAVLARQLLRDFWHWRFDEFALVLREAVAGRYGITYDRVDAATVNGWCATYEAGRNEVEADANEQQARELKLAEARGPKSLLTAHPDYASARQQLEALSDGNLVATARHYRQQPEPDNQFVADIADEEIGRRNLARVLGPLRERLQNRQKPVPTLREQMAAQQQATRDRLNTKLLGENSPVWGIAQAWLDILDVESEPVTPPTEEAPAREAA